MKRLATPRRFLAACAVVALGAGLLLAPGAARASEPSGLLLWNRLGSAGEVTDSSFGPDLVLFDCAQFVCGIDVPGALGFPAGVFGGAASITGGPYFSGARVHSALLRDTILDPEQGAVEAWYRQTSDPVPYLHNPHRIFGGPYPLPGVDEANLYSQDRLDSGDPRLHFRIFFGGPNEVAARSLIDGVPGSPISAQNGQWIHVAGVWDRSGIAGTVDTVRLYVDGEVVAASQASDWGTTPCRERPEGDLATGCFIDVAGCNDTCADTFAVDNLKVWNYAKSDYSDRFHEGFESTNQSPDCSGVTDAPNSIWPQTRDKLALISLSGASDLDGDSLAYRIDGVTQDEPASGVGDDTLPDAALTPAGPSSNQVLVRTEANSHGNGRVYRIAYTVFDGKGGTCSGTAGPSGTTTAMTGVQRKKETPAIDDGSVASWDSLTGVPVP